MGVHSAIGSTLLFLFFAVVHGAGLATTNSLVYGEGWDGVSSNFGSVVPVNVVNTFYIQAVDSNNNNVTTGGDNFSVTFSFVTPNWTLTTDNLDGTYTVTYLLPGVGVGGSCMISIYLDGNYFTSTFLSTAYPDSISTTTGLAPSPSTTGATPSSTTGQAPSTVAGVASTNSLVYGEGWDGVSSDFGNVVPVNVVNTFYIQAVDSNNNNVTTGGADFSVTFSFVTPNWTLTTDNMDGTYTVTYLLPDAGVGGSCMISIYLNGSYFTSTFLSTAYPDSISTTTGLAPSPSTTGAPTPSSTTGQAPPTGAGVASTNSIAYGEGWDGLPSDFGNVVPVNVVNTFYIQAVDSNNNNVTTGGADFSVSFYFVTPNWTLTTDNMDGTYTVTYLLPAVSVGGSCMINANLDGSSFASNFLSTAYPDPTTTTSVSSTSTTSGTTGGAGVASTNSFLYGEGVEGLGGFRYSVPFNYTNVFYLQAVDSLGNNVTTGGADFGINFGFFSVNWSTVVDNMDGTYTMSYLLYEPDDYAIGSGAFLAVYVYLNGERFSYNFVTPAPLSCFLPPYCTELYPTTGGTLPPATTTGSASTTGYGFSNGSLIVYGEGWVGFHLSASNPLVLINTTQTFYIQAVNHSTGNNITTGGADFSAVLMLISSYNLTVTDNLNGTYTVNYFIEPTTLNSAGPLLRILVYLNGTTVAESDFLEAIPESCLQPPYCPTMIPRKNHDVAIAVPLSLAAVIGGVMGACAFMFFRRKRMVKRRWVYIDQHLGRDGSSLADVELVKISPNLQRFFTTEDPSFVLKVQTPALNFNEKGRLCPVGRPISHDFSMTNTTYQSHHFFLQGGETDKFCIAFSPTSGEIKRGETVTVQATLFFKCTTHISAEVLLAVLDVGHVYLPIDVESELSTRIDVDEISLNETPIGEGGFGVVYRADWRGMEVAVKISKSSFSAPARAKFKEECDMIAKLRHPNIINFIGAVISPSMVAMVTEFCPIGNLATLVRNTNITPELQVKLLLDIAKGMDFLHMSGILHRDLKTDNVLVVSANPDTPVCAKISDFGSSRTYDPARSHTVTSGVGTPTHMAPEILKGKGYTDKADVYSFAILMYEVFTHIEPYFGPEFNLAWDVAQFVVSGKRLSIPLTTDSRATALINRCWNEEPVTRPDFGEIVYNLSIMAGVTVLPDLTPRKPLNLFVPPSEENSPFSSAHTPVLFSPREGYHEPTIYETSDSNPSNVSNTSESSQSSGLSDAKYTSSLEDLTCASSGLRSDLHSDSSTSNVNSRNASNANSRDVTPSSFIYSDSKDEPMPSKKIRLPNEANTSLSFKQINISISS